MSRWNKLSVKRLKFGPYEIAALIIIALAVLLRIFLISKGWPETDSDEGTMGLEAMHIAFRGEHPVFLYGQNYMGTIEAYLGALLFRLFGVSLFFLRLDMVLIFTLFLAGMYLLTSLLYTKKLALVTLALLSVGARNVLLPEIRAVGGAVETLLFGTTLLLLASWLALTAEQDPLPRKRRWRLLAYGCWGLTMGLGLWSHILVVPFVLTGGLILVMFCRREVRTWAPFWLFVGLVIGALPLIYYNATAPSGQNSLVIALSIHSTSGSGIPPGSATLAKQLSGTMLYSLPIATGISPLCKLQELPLFGPASPNPPLCIFMQGGWSLAYITLMVLAIVLTIVPLWKLWQQHRSQPQEWTSEERQETIIHFARLMLLCSAGLTLVLFAISPLAALNRESTRYLIGLLIATPAVLWPVWHGMSSRGKLPTRRSEVLKIVLRGGFILLIGVTFLVGTINNFSEIAGDERLSQQDATLAHDLVQDGITHIYSGYWICDRLTFASQEQVICSVVSLQLKNGLNRYSPYYTIVTADAKAPYVFPLGSDFALAAARNPGLSSGHYRQFVLDGYVVYQPIGTGLSTTGRKN